MNNNIKFDGFKYGRKGNLVVDRELLHQSEGYKKQLHALDEFVKYKENNMINYDDDKLIENVRSKFTSGNDIPVERAWITEKEWEAIERFLKLQYESKMKMQLELQSLRKELQNYENLNVRYKK